MIYASLMEQVDSQPVAYPLPEAALLPTWRSRRSQGLGALAVAAFLLALGMRWPVRLADIDDALLRHALPATLAFVMAFAPTSSTPVGRVAQYLTVVGLSVAVFAGDWLPLMLACYPVVLVIAVVVGELGPTRRYWAREP